MNEHVKAIMHNVCRETESVTNVHLKKNVPNRNPNIYAFNI